MKYKLLILFAIFAFVRPCRAGTGNGGTIDTATVYDFYDQSPMPLGDIHSYLGKLEHNLVWHQTSWKDTAGFASVSFNVCADGHLCNFMVDNDMPKDVIGKTVIDALIKMGDWKPARLQGKAVKVQYALTVSYEFHKNRKGVRTTISFDEPPAPPGGNDGYMQYLKNNIVYPPKAVEAHAQGVVYVSMVIEKDGTLSDVHVQRETVKYGCGEEAVRVIKTMPPWKPGKMSWQPVKMQYVVPVMFKLN